MSLKRLSDVSVGSLVKFGDSVYKVDTNNGHQVLFVKQVGPFFESQKRGAGTLINGYEGAEFHVVNVVEVASDSQSDLTSQLRQQVKAQSLTESLRAQVEGDSSLPWDDDEDDEEDYDDDEDDEDEPSARYGSSGAYAFGLDAVAFTSAASVPSLDIEKAKKDILTATLRSQQALQGAAQALLKQAEIKNHLDVVDHNLIILRDDADRESHKLNESISLVDKVVDYVDAHAEAIHYLEEQQDEQLDRISALERKQFEEENKVSIQNKLNEKLALQAKFNQASKKQTTGGNGMNNVLGAFKNQFGKVEGKFAFAATGGIALRSGLTNTFVAYDKDAKTLTDVSGLTLKFDVPAFKLPVASAQVAVGDLIIHNSEFVFVTKKADGYLDVINPEKGTKGAVVPTKNAILNAAFYTVVKTLDAAGGDGFNPLLLMALSKGESKDSLLPLMLMGGGLGGNAQAGQAGAIDPMMLMLLGDKTDDLLPLILMQQGGALGGDAAQGGIQSILPFLLMGDDKSSKDMLPLLMMSGGLNGQQAGGINPMMMMALAGDGDIDPMMMMAMGGFGGAQGGLFGQAPKQEANQPVAPVSTESTDSTDGE